jgi:hypothetical protein
MESALKKVNLQKIVSGGQTGVDRAALDAAQVAGIEVGGWCPAGRRAEDGIIAPRYPLKETPSSAYAQRTAWNVRDSDGTLVFVLDTPAGGTSLTIKETKRQGKPLLMVDLTATMNIRTVSEWIAVHEIKRLNIAGPRESESPGIYRQAFSFIEALLR